MTWTVVDAGDITQIKTESKVIHKEPTESIADFMYRMFHSYPSDYEIHMRPGHAIIIKRSRIDAQKQSNSSKKPRS